MCSELTVCECKTTMSAMLLKIFEMPILLLAYIVFVVISECYNYNGMCSIIGLGLSFDRRL